MTIALLVAECLAAAIAIGLVLGRSSHRRRSSFDATMAREHPELPPPRAHDGRVLAFVASQAVNVWTPSAPRTLGGGWRSEP